MTATNALGPTAGCTGWWAALPPTPTGIDRDVTAVDDRPPAAAPDALPTRPERLAGAFGDRIPVAGGALWPVDVRYVDRAPWAGCPTSLPRPPRR